MMTVVPFIIAMFLSINMGGSGIGPSFSTAFGADAIKKNLIALLFGIMVFIGAIVAGDQTAKTVGSGIISADLMSITQVSIILLSVAISLLVANLFGVPQSTSQSTVLAVLAPGLLYSNISTKKLFIEIIPTWFILPLISFVMCFLITRYVYNPIRKKIKFSPKKANKSKVVDYMIVVISMYVAFSIGSNNVANASGPLAYMTMNLMDSNSEELASLVLMLCIMLVAPCFGIGASIFGDKILRSTGKELFLFGRGEALLISFVSASLLLGASLVRGIPTSLVQLNVGAIIGVGIANLGAKNILKKTEVQKFFYIWLISPVIAFLLSLGLTYWLIG